MWYTRFLTKINSLCKSGTWTTDHGLNGAPTRTEGTIKNYLLLFLLLDSHGLYCLSIDEWYIDLYQMCDKGLMRWIEILITEYLVPNCLTCCSIWTEDIITNLLMSGSIRAENCISNYLVGWAVWSIYCFADSLISGCLTSRWGRTWTSCRISFNISKCIFFFCSFCFLYCLFFLSIFFVI